MADASVPEVRSWPVRAIQAFTGPWTARNLFSWIALFLLFFFLKGCIIDQFSVPTGSMEPTIIGKPGFFQGDRVLVNKWLFGPRIPFTATRLWDWAEPKRWDIVVFRNPDRKNPIKYLVKRVVGLPGERVILHNGKVTVNGDEIPFPDSMPQDTYYVNNVDMQAMIDRWEQSPEQREFLRLVMQAHPMRYCVEPALGVPPADEFCVVPEDRYFVLGDNSLSPGQFSVDSRVWGWVPRGNLLGRAFAIWWPWEHRRDFTGFSRTWWGKALLYGLPASVLLGILWMETRSFRRRRPSPQDGRDPL